MRIFFNLAAAVTAAALLAPHAQAGNAAIQEWQVPWEQTRPRDPAVAPDGTIWFVGQAGDYVGHFDPASEDFERFPLPDGTGPHNVIVTGDGEIWYTGNRAAHVGRLDPESGDIHKVAMPDDRARDPHTLIETPDGNLWFTVQGGNLIGHLDRGSEEVTLIDVPFDRARPYGIVVTPDGRPWATLFGTNRLATVDPASTELSTVELPREDARPRRLARTDDGRIWYVDYAQGYIGRFDPADETFREWRSPAAGQAHPYGMVADGGNRLWYVETGPQPNVFVGFDPERETFSETPIPSGAGAVRHMDFDADRNAVWFGTDANTLGRADLP